MRATRATARAMAVAGVLMVASAGASPPGGPSGSPPAPPGRLLRDDPPSEDRTPPPSRQEWASAPDAGLARISDPACSARRVREWVRVTCDRFERNVVLVAGNKEGTDFGGAAGTVWATFAVRRSDRRVILFNRATNWSPQADALVSDQWLEGDPGPIVVVTGMH
jgi:hypothetical protein